MARGDLIFYPYNDFTGWIVAHATGGRFSHVEIDCGSGKSIGALGGGVTLHASNYRGNVLADFHSKCDPAKRELAMQWLEGMVGTPYGWSDIMADAEKFLGIHIPGISTSFLYILHKNTFNCSHLAVHFLKEAGYPVSDILEKDEATVSPNDLARLGGVK